MCANLYFGNVFHVLKSAGLMVLPFPHHLKPPEPKCYLCSSASINPHCFPPPLTAGRQRGRSYRQGHRYLLSYTLPHFARETETTVSPFTAEGNEDRGHWQTSKSCYCKVPEHEPTFPGTHQVLPKAKTEVLTGPKACLAQFST